MKSYIFNPRSTPARFSPFPSTSVVYGMSCTCGKGSSRSSYSTTSSLFPPPHALPRLNIFHTPPPTDLLPPHHSASSLWSTGCRSKGKFFLLMHFNEQMRIIFLALPPSRPFLLLQTKAKCSLPIKREISLSSRVIC